MCIQTYVLPRKTPHSGFISNCNIGVNTNRTDFTQCGLFPTYSLKKSLAYQKEVRWVYENSKNLKASNARNCICSTNSEWMRMSLPAEVTYIVKHREQTWRVNEEESFKSLMFSKEHKEISLFCTPRQKSLL